MIVKLRDGFRSSELEPVMLILNKDEKQAIANLGDDQVMLAFYPVNGGFTQELVTAWMQEGLTFQDQPVAEAVAAPKQEVIDGRSNKI